MSHSSGRVKFKDGTIMHFEYDGTVDICMNPLFDTYEEMDKNWRNYSISRNDKCTCGNEETAEIATCYGGGFYWVGKACKYCKLILDPNVSFFFHKTYNNLPDWWELENA